MKWKVINDFINYFINAKIDYFSGKEIEAEDEKINTIIIDKAYNEFLPNNE